MRFHEILNERGEAYLYHITNPDDAARIIAQNTIKAMTDHRAERMGMAGSKHASEYGQVSGVSLTRNPAFAKVWVSGKGVVFVLDWTKLRQSFRIRPYDYNSGGTMTGYQSVRSEAEEFVIGAITPLDRYLVEIRMPRDVYEECVADNEDYTNPEEDSRYWPLTSSPLLRII